jgi:hypothetical protein
MKLYELNHGDRFKIIDENPKVPVASAEAEQGKVYLFSHIDGMYSYCKDGDDVVHFAAWTEVEHVAKMEK